LRIRALPSVLFFVVIVVSIFIPGIIEVLTEGVIRISVFVSPIDDAVILLGAVVNAIINIAFSHPFTVVFQARAVIGALVHAIIVILFLFFVSPAVQFIKAVAVGGAIERVVVNPVNNAEIVIAAGVIAIAS
jgi:hypothetical protein